MKNYRAMTVQQLREEVFGLGDNPIGMTKTQMVKWMEDYERTRNMTMEELLAEIKKLNA